MFKLKKFMSLLGTKKRPPEMIKIQIIYSGDFQRVSSVNFGQVIQALPKICFPRRKFIQIINVDDMMISDGNI